MTYHFPDAYAGSNTKIRDTLNNLILKSPQNWREFPPVFESQRARPAQARSRSPSRRVPMRVRRDERRPALLPDHGHRRRVGRGSLRCAAHACVPAPLKPRGSTHTRRETDAALLALVQSACPTRV